MRMRSEWECREHGDGDRVQCDVCGHVEKLDGARPICVCGAVLMPRFAGDVDYTARLFCVPCIFGAPEGVANAAR